MAIAKPAKFPIILSLMLLQIAFLSHHYQQRHWQCYAISPSQIAVHNLHFIFLVDVYNFTVCIGPDFFKIILNKKYQVSAHLYQTHSIKCFAGNVSS